MRGSCVPRISMHLSAVAVWLLAACGGQDTPPPAVAEDEPAATASARPASGSFDPCTLLTKEDIVRTGDYMELEKRANDLVERLGRAACNV